MGQYEFLEEVAIADCAVEIQGDDLKDLFETAAAALAALGPLTRTTATPARPPPLASA